MQSFEEMTPMSMPSGSRDYGQFDELAEEFAERYRRGERPSLQEYVDRLPGMADAIREMFPALVEVEQVQGDAREDSLQSLPRELPPHTRIGDYRLLREVGRGGMGVVYEAEQVSLGRRVALKVLPSHVLGRGRLLERFHREAKAAARLHHSNIVPVFEVGRDGGVAFYAMQFIQGQGLDQLIVELRRLRRSAPDAQLAIVPPGASTSAVLAGGTAVSSVDSSGRRQPFFHSVAQIGLQASQGLAYAHSRGVIHRDIKPSNLLLDTEGVVWITDFGLAKAEDDGLTATGDILGTIRYMAPERFRGLGDARADIYALGLTLYELLTFRPAFDTSDRLTMIERIKNEEPPRPRSLDRRIPRDLETIVLKACEKVADRRYATAEAMAEDLRHFLADEPISARRASTAERSWQWARRNPTIATLGVVLTAVLVLATAGSLLAAFYFQRQEQAQERLAARNLTLADASEAAGRLAQKRADEIQETLYSAEMNLAGQAAETPAGVGRVSELLGHWSPTTADRDLRGWEWYYLSGLGQQPVLAWPHRHSAGVWSVRWDPAGRRLATCGHEGKVRLWDASTGRLIATLRGHATFANALSWDPRGRLLASGSQDETIRLWDTESGREIATLRGQKAHVRALSWSPDGRRLASSGLDGLIKIWDPDAQRELATLRGHAAEVHPLSWSPDSRRLASGGHDGTLKIWDPAAGHETATFPGPGAVEHAVAWSPDGKRLASGGERGAVTIWDPETGRPTLSLPRAHSGIVRALEWNPDNRRFASAGSDWTAKIWQADSGQILETFQGNPGMIETIHWSPDGQRLACGGTQPWVLVWEPSRKPATSSFRGHTDAVWCVAWSPDGRRLASGGLDGTVRISDAATGQETASLRGHKSLVAGVSWAPDGRHLASASHDGSVKLWDATTGRETATLHPHEGSATTVTWSPDGKHVASATQVGQPPLICTLRLWDADTGRVIANVPKLPVVWALSFRPDGRLLAGTVITGAIKVWDAEDLREIATLPGNTRDGRAFCWSHGRRLASGGGDRQVRVGDLATGRQTATLSGHTDWVMGVSWSPDGRRLASASNDGTVKIWDPDTGQQTATILGHGDRVTAVVWSPDGQRLASAGWDRTVRIWDASPGYLRARSPSLLPDLDRRLAIEPRSAPDLQLRAEVHARLGQWDQAASDWSRAVGFQPTNAPRRFQAGWWVVGPIDGGFGGPPTPESELDLFLPVDVVDPRGSKSLPFHWRAATVSALGCLDLAALFPNVRRGSARALLRVYAPAEQAVTAQVRSAGSLQFWVNGRLVHERPQAPPQDADDERVPLTLRAGWNSLLFQIEVGHEWNWLSLTL